MEYPFDVVQEITCSAHLDTALGLISRVRACGYYRKETDAYKQLMHAEQKIRSLLGVE